MTRQEHLEWCKKRAMEYVDSGNVIDALTSMGSDLQKHPDTKDHIGMQLGMGLLMLGKLSSQEEMRKFIDGFN